MGHVGLTPQTVEKLGGFKVQGKDAASAQEIMMNAKKLEEVGCFSLVLECVPAPLAQMITKKLRIPTIGIGAGPHCDGQVLVTPDLLGLFTGHQPKFVKRYAHLSDTIRRAIQSYAQEVTTGQFPSDEQSYRMDLNELDKLVPNFRKN